VARTGGKRVLEAAATNENSVPDASSTGYVLAKGAPTAKAAFVSTSLAVPAAAGLAALEGGTAVELVVRRGQKGVAYVHPFPTLPI
jgi:signal transduction protein with GAF and PtsI domain